MFGVRGLRYRRGLNFIKLVPWKGFSYMHWIINILLTVIKHILACQLSAVGRNPSNLSDFVLPVCLNLWTPVALSQVSWSPPNTTLATPSGTYPWRLSRILAMPSVVFSFSKINPRERSSDFWFISTEYSWRMWLGTNFLKGLRNEMLLHNTLSNSML